MFLGVLMAFFLDRAGGGFGADLVSRGGVAGDSRGIGERHLVVLAICGGVAGVADNIVRPLLLRNRTRLNDLLLFISILGGLDVFGLLGLVAGPTIVAAALGVFRVYMDHRDELEKGDCVTCCLTRGQNLRDVWRSVLEYALDELNEEHNGIRA